MSKPVSKRDKSTVQYSNLLADPSLAKNNGPDVSKHVVDPRVVKSDGKSVTLSWKTEVTPSESDVWIVHCEKTQASPVEDESEARKARKARSEKQPEKAEPSNKYTSGKKGDQRLGSLKNRWVSYDEESKTVTFQVYGLEPKTNYKLSVSTVHNGKESAKTEGVVVNSGRKPTPKVNRNKKQKSQTPSQPVKIVEDAVKDLEVVSANGTSAVLSWTVNTEMSNVSSWLIAYNEGPPTEATKETKHGVEVKVGDAGVRVSNKTVAVSLSNLKANTQYWWWVKTITNDNSRCRSTQGPNFNSSDRSVSIEETESAGNRSVQPAQARDPISGVLLNDGATVNGIDGVTTCYRVAGGATITFYDTGGPSGDYFNSEEYGTEFYPENPSDKLEIEVIDFNLEDRFTDPFCFDTLTIYDGTLNINNGIFYEGCFDQDSDNGTQIDPRGLKFTSTHSSGAVSFFFDSDGSLTRSGWEIRITNLGGGGGGGGGVPHVIAPEVNVRLTNRNTPLDPRVPVHASFTVVDPLEGFPEPPITVETPDTPYLFNGAGLIDTPTTLTNPPLAGSDITVVAVYRGDHGGGFESFQIRYNTADGDVVIPSQPGTGADCLLVESIPATIPMETWNNWVQNDGPDLTFWLPTDSDVDSFVCSENKFQLFFTYSPSAGASQARTNSKPRLTNRQAHSNARAITGISGNLTTSDPQFARPSGTTTCSTTSTADHYYNTYAFTVSQNGLYTFACTGSGDLYGIIFQNCFDPINPCTNFVIANDDSNGGLDPLIQTNLVSGTTYILVTTTFSGNTTSDYSWTFNGPGEINDVTTISNTIGPITITGFGQFAGKCWDIAEQGRSPNQRTYFINGAFVDAAKTTEEDYFQIEYKDVTTFLNVNVIAPDPVIVCEAQTFTIPNDRTSIDAVIPVHIITPLLPPSPFDVGILFVGANGVKVPTLRLPSIVSREEAYFEYTLPLEASDAPPGSGAFLDVVYVDSCGNLAQIQPEITVLQDSRPVIVPPRRDVQLQIKCNEQGVNDCFYVTGYGNDTSSLEVVVANELGVETPANPGPAATGNEYCYPFERGCNTVISRIVSGGGMVQNLETFRVKVVDEPGVVDHLSYPFLSTLYSIKSPQAHIAALVRLEKWIQQVVKDVPTEVTDPQEKCVILCKDYLGFVKEANALLKKIATLKAALDADTEGGELTLIKENINEVIGDPPNDLREYEFDFSNLGGEVQDVNVRLKIDDHTWLSDLVVTVISPKGTEVVTFTLPFGNCSGQEWPIDVTLDDQGQVIPNDCNALNANGASIQCLLLGVPTPNVLAQFNGESPTGTWKVRIEDTFSLDEGVIKTVGLEIDASPPKSASPAVVNGFINLFKCLLNSKRFAVLTDNCQRLELEDDEIPVDKIGCANCYAVVSSFGAFCFGTNL